MSPLLLFGALGGVIMVIALIGEAVRDPDGPLPDYDPFHAEYHALIERYSTS